MKETSDLDGLRRAAELELQFLIAARDRVIDDTLSMGKWLLASLLAVNGGAALAVLSSTHLSQPLIPSAFFAAGVAMALLNGVVSQSVSLTQISKFAPIIGYWLSVAQDGERLDDLEETHRQIGQRMIVVSRLAAVPGWLSGIAFVGGAISAGLQFS